MRIEVASVRPEEGGEALTTVRPTHLVDRAGVARASYLVTTRLGWLFREQETSDVGIDAHLEVVDGASLTGKTTGGATGRLLAVQVKSGDSQFAAASEGGWWYPCDAAHVEYWTNHSLPVALLLFHPASERVYWQHINADTLVSTGKNYKVFVPFHQEIDEANAEVLGRPAKLREDVAVIEEATDRLPGDTRLRLLRDHQAGAGYAEPLASFLAETDDPAATVSVLLTQPLAWLTNLEAEHEENAWKVIASYSTAHELGLPAVESLERAAEQAVEDKGRWLALAAFSALSHAPDRALRLADAAEEEGDTALVAAVRAVAGAGGSHPTQLPDTLVRAFASSDPAATRDVNVLRFAAHCHFAADRHDDGEHMLERALLVAPGNPDVQLDLARCLLSRSAAGAPQQAFLDAGRAQRLALAARADFRRWRGPSSRAARIVMQARLHTGEVDAAIRTAIAGPDGDAQEREAADQPLRMGAIRLAYRAGRTDLADVIAAGLTGDRAQLQLAAFAADADPAASRETRIAAWQGVAAGAIDDDEQWAAAVALSALGVWPVSHLDELREQGAIHEAVYQTRCALAEAVNGDTAGAVRRLREWENHSAVAATGLVEQHERDGNLVLAAEAAERAGLRFGDTPLRVLAVDLWERSGERDQARIKALTLLGRPFLPAAMRLHLRGLAIQWANDRRDWTDMEEHALVGLAETVGIEHLTAIEGAAGAVPHHALPFAWAAIRAQLNARKLSTAQDTLARFAPQIRDADDARPWLMLVAWSGWTLDLAETAIGLAERYRRDDPELTGALLAGLLTATGEPAQSPADNGDGEAEAPKGPRTGLDLPEPLATRLKALLADPPTSRALTAMDGDAEDLVHYVEQTLGPREALLDAAADSVRISALPMGMLAWVARRPVALAVTQRAAGLIPACSVNPAHIAAEVRAVQNSLDGTVVMDATALAVMSLVPGRLDQLRAVFAASPTPKAVCDDLIETRYALHETLRSSGQLGVRGGRFILTEYTDQDRQHLAQQAEAFSQIIPSLHTVDVTDLTEIRRRLGITSVPQDADAAWLSAAQHALDTDVAVWCDDAALRGMLIAAGISTFGTVALLHVLKERSDYSDFTDSRHERDIRKLVEAYVVDLPVSVNDIADIARARAWHPAPAATMFARPQFWQVEAARPLWAAVAETVWDNAPPQLAAWMDFAAAGRTALLEPQDVPQAVVELAAETLLAVGVGPETARAVLESAVRSLDASGQAASRRRQVTGLPLQELRPMVEDDILTLLRQVATRQLISVQGFTPGAAEAIVRAALPDPPGRTDEQSTSVSLLL
ncbi:DUF4365 domain-containing protein [Streptomyces goshikiensis]|uniref:DUF4365 domain-containing protein n=1 Tax=Streptomyces goshikiensis TaxID=1942 RepID=UPI0033E5398B